MADRDARLDALINSIVGRDGVESAALFLAERGTDGLPLATRAGIASPALDGLVAAVAHPAHPIRRTFADALAGWDALPMNPGGPRLRSHVPVIVGADSSARV